MTRNDRIHTLDELADRNKALINGAEPGEERPNRGREVDTQFLEEMMYALENVSLGTHQLLYFSSMKYAKNHLDPDANTLNDAIDELATIFDVMNVGTLSLEEDANEGEDGVTKVHLAENALTMREPSQDKPLCYFISGYIAGFLENAVDHHFVVNEVSCTAQGEEVCVFRIQKR